MRGLGAFGLGIGSDTGKSSLERENPFHISELLRSRDRPPTNRKYLDREPPMERIHAMAPLSTARTSSLRCPSKPISSNIPTDDAAERGSKMGDAGICACIRKQQEIVGAAESAGVFW